jgi:RNA polymerase sigma-70 factor, ECF subfamily
MDETTEIARAKAGDRQAFARLVTRYQARVRGLARTLLGDAALAEDVAQEVFLAAWRALPTYRGQGSLASWLLTIARRKAIDLGRGRGLDDPLDETIPAAVGSATDQLVDIELRRALELLDDRRREAFVLVVVGGLAYGEAARALGCRSGTVASRVARARADLRELLKERVT